MDGLQCSHPFCTSATVSHLETVVKLVLRKIYYFLKDSFRTFCDVCSSQSLNMLAKLRVVFCQLRLFVESS